jgi:hypothetical protein
MAPAMRRRLPHEPELLLAELTSWIEWRYATSDQHLVLTSAPSTLPSAVERWMPSAVWRLAWLGSGVAILYGLAPGSGPRKYFVVQHDALHPRKEGVFEKLADETWRRLDGDGLEPASKAVRRKSPDRWQRDPLAGFQRHVCAPSAAASTQARRRSRCTGRSPLRQVQ